MLANLLADAEVVNLKTITFMGNKYPVLESFGFLQTIFSIVSYALIPLFIAVAAAGSIYAIVLGVNLARAADAETRDAAKKRLIWAIVGLVSIIVLIILLNWIMSMIPGWVTTYSEDVSYTIDGTPGYTWTKSGGWNPKLP